MMMKKNEKIKKTYILKIRCIQLLNQLMIKCYLFIYLILAHFLPLIWHYWSPNVAKWLCLPFSFLCYYLFCRFNDNVSFTYTKSISLVSFLLYPVSSQLSTILVGVYLLLRGYFLNLWFAFMCKTFSSLE